MTIGTLHTNLQDFTMGGNQPPYTYLGVATGFMPGVTTLAASGVSCAMPLAHLAAHTLECALKAYISRDGDDSKARGPIQHNLSGLWALAHQEGLKIAATPYDWVATLSGLHDKPFYLRYSEGVNGVILPSAEPMATELKELIEVVRAALVV